MKVAVNTRLLLKNQMDGIGVFTFESFKRITVKHPEVDFVFIFDRKPRNEFIFSSNVLVKTIPPRAKHPILYKIWYQYSLHRMLKRINADIFVGTDGMIPLKTRTPTLSVIHDLNFEHYPKNLPKRISHYYRKYFPTFAAKATRIATVSNYSKQDIIKTYGIEENKIDVVYNGANKKYTPISIKEALSVKSRYTKGEKFFLFVGTLHPRKNLVNLFKAFDKYKMESDSKIKLLIVGRKMWWTKELKRTYNKLKYRDDVIFSGRVDQQDLYKITASAEALTYVPFFEGFGIPIVEAMSCEIPIITSNVASMPEVVGNAGIMVTPNSVEEISKAMKEIVTNQELKNKLINEGKKQIAKFNWDLTADLLWKSITKTIDA